MTAGYPVLQSQEVEQPDQVKLQMLGPAAGTASVRSMADERGSSEDLPELHDRPLQKTELSEEIEDLRTAFRLDNAANERIVATRASAQYTACRCTLDQLQTWHRAIANETDLELVAYSRGSAVWLLAGRILGLAEAMWVQINAGISNEVMVTARAIHEAARVLPVLRDIEEEELLHIWLQDEGKYRYVRPKSARDALARYEEKLGEAMAQKGLPAIPGSTEATEEMYDRLSRSAHNRRSACLDSVWEPARTMAYGRHPSPLRRAATVEWGCAMTVEVALAVGDGLETFYGHGFVVSNLTPLIRSIQAVREAEPLDEGSVRRAAKTA